MKLIKFSVVSILITALTLPAWAEESQPGVISVRASGAVSKPVQETVVPDAVNVEERSLNKTRLTFMDSKLFDMRLGKELESGKDLVEIDVTGRVPLSNIPPRIDKWVVRSAEEGKVELLASEPAPKTRFIFSLIPMIFNAFGAYKDMQEERMFDQAKRYDTKIYYKKDESGDTLIEKIVMIKRKKK